MSHLLQKARNGRVSALESCRERAGETPFGTGAEARFRMQRQVRSLSFVSSRGSGRGEILPG
ncbi:hypothetical protein ACQ5SP_02130 [Rhodovulum sp. YNF3179]|uniref:hypothetical protein n=1 Tax=Rhodovulum sp. YNF3179 TaxID=3425127 RepID=UPI003D333451